MDELDEAEPDELDALEERDPGSDDVMEGAARAALLGGDCSGRR
jgi:hypothetical protein